MTEDGVISARLKAILCSGSGYHASRPLNQPLNDVACDRGCGSKGLEKALAEGTDWCG
jgi:hypothetical protein